MTKRPGRARHHEFTVTGVMALAGKRADADRISGRSTCSGHRQARRQLAYPPGGCGSSPASITGSTLCRGRGDRNVEHASAIHIIQGQFSSTPHRPANAIRGTTDIAWQRRQEIIGHGSGAVSRTADCDIAVAWVTDGVVQIAASRAPPCR
jgi:hypothetical protein